jgi:hypothetical protein
MTTKAAMSQFDFHVDAKYFNFQWSEAMYINVKYSALKRGNDVVVSVYEISGAPWLISSIAMRGNWMFVDKEIIAAAQDHAEKAFGGQVHPTIMSAIAPHI